MHLSVREKCERSRALVFFSPILQDSSQLPSCHPIPRISCGVPSRQYGPLISIFPSSVREVNPLCTSAAGGPSSATLSLASSPWHQALIDA